MKMYFLSKQEIKSIAYKKDVDIIYTFDTNKLYVCKKNSIQNFSDTHIQFEYAEKKECDKR